MTMRRKVVSQAQGFKRTKRPSNATGRSATDADQNRLQGRPRQRRSHYVCVERETKAAGNVSPVCVIGVTSPIVFYERAIVASNIKLDP